MCVNIFFADMYTYFSKINDGSGVKWKPRGQECLKSVEFISLFFLHKVIAETVKEYKHGFL